MSKTPPPPKGRHLQLVSNGSARPEDALGGGVDDPQGEHGRLFAQVARDGRPRLRGGWGLICALLLAIGVVYAGLHVGAKHLRATTGAHFDGRRFGLTASVRSHANPDSPLVLADGDTVRTDDTWQFVLHNRSHKNMWFGIFAATPAGQIIWFYPRDGSGANMQTLPLPAINTITLPDGVTPEALSAGPLQIYGLFTPAPVELDQVETAFAAHALAGLRAGLKADVQTLTVQAIAP